MLKFSGKMDKPMVEDYLNILMGIVLKVNLNIIEWMVLVSIPMPQGDSIKDNGKMTISMVMESNNTIMDHNIKENLKTD